MRYLLGGYYGMRNVGDDVLLYVTLAEVHRMDPEAEFTVISSVPETTPPGARVRVVPGSRRLETLRRLLRHDVWLFGGGGLLQDGSPQGVPYLERVHAWARVAKWLGRKIALVGIGVGPLETAEGRRVSRRLLELADFVSVRDQESVDAVAALSPGLTPHLTGDLAFLLPRHAASGEAAVKTAPARKTLGLSLLPFAGSLGKDKAADARVVERVAEALNEVMARNPGWDVRLFEFFSGSVAHGDATVLESLRAKIRCPERVSYRPYDGDFLALFAEMRECGAFLGMRFHSCLLAHLAAVPCLMIAYHPKSDSLAARLHLSADAVMSLADLQNSHELSARLGRLLADGERFRPGGPIGPLTQQSALNFSLLREWLSRKGGSVTAANEGTGESVDMQNLAQSRRDP